MKTICPRCESICDWMRLSERWKCRECGVQWFDPELEFDGFQGQVERFGSLAVLEEA